MPSGYRLLHNQVTRLKTKTVDEIMTLWNPWIHLTQILGPPQRMRLFSPLTDLLAVPLSGPGGRSLLPNSGPEIFIVAGPENGKERLAQHRLLL
jgi:hypothetical protein